MRASNYFNIFLFLLTKYAVFFFVLAFKDNRFKKIVINISESGRDLVVNSFYYVVYVLIHMIIFTLPLSVPIYFSFKVRNWILFIFFIMLILIVEYFFYVYLTSQRHIDVDGIWNGIISIIFLMFFFFKHIKALFK